MFKSYKFLTVLTVIFIASFQYIDCFLDFSSVTLKKCYCGSNKVFTDDNLCIPKGTNVLVDIGYMTIINSTDFGNVEINDTICPVELTKVQLGPESFFLIEDGSLFDAELGLPVKFEHFCIEHIMENGDLSWMANVCRNISIPKCCLKNQVLDEENSKCSNSINMTFFPPLFAGELGDTVYLDQDIYGNHQMISSCSIDSKLRVETFNETNGIKLFVNDKSVDIVLDNRSGSIKDTNYCIGQQITNDQINYVARFCVPPQLPIIQKCCYDGKVYDETYGECVYFEFQNLLLNYHNEDTGDLTPIGNNFEFNYGFPICDDGLSKFNDSEYRLLKSGELNLFGHVLDQHSYCIEDEIDINGTMKQFSVVCDPNTPIEDPLWLKILKCVLMVTSCIFLLATLIVYIGVKELRDKISGKCLISEVSSLFVVYLGTVISVYSQIDHRPFCIFIGCFIYVMILSSFFWLNVMCFDMWSTFTKIRRTRSVGGSNKRFILYCLYGWGIPLVFGIVSLIIDNLPTQYEYWSFFRPGFDLSCYIHTSDLRTAYIYVFGPMLILLTVNFLFFIHISMYLYKTQREIAKALRVESSTTSRSSNEKERFSLYVKLFILMGITWIAEVISAQTKVLNENFIYVWIITDAINALRGLFIFIIFVCKKRTISKIRKAWEPRLQIMRGLTSHFSSRTKSSWFSDSATDMYGRKISTASNNTLSSVVLAQGIPELIHMESISEPSQQLPQNTEKN